MLLSHAMTYFFLRRPNRKSLDKKISVLDSTDKNWREGLVNNSTVAGSTLKDSRLDSSTDNQKGPNDLY